MNERTDLIESKQEPNACVELNACDRYVSVYIETTGLDPENDSPILLAAVRVMNGRSVGKFKTLIDPERRVSAEVTRETGLTDRLLEGSPKLENMLPAFIGFIANDPIVGHNISFDAEFLDAACRRVLGKGFENELIDTAVLAAELFPGLESTRLNDLAEGFFGGRGVDRRIDSKADVAAKCFEYMKRYKKQHSEAAIEPKPEKNEQEPEKTEPDTETGCPV